MTNKLKPKQYSTLIISILTAPQKKLLKASNHPDCAAWLCVLLHRMVLRFVTVSLSFLLMLCVMSFSVVIFFGVVTGMAIGSLLFHRYFLGLGRCEALGPFLYHR